jgi:L-fuculose-phosphate aldolase
LFELNSEHEAARARVAAAARDLAASGLVLGTAGNVSERVDDVVAITPTGAALAALDTAQVTLVDLDGGMVFGDLAPTSELDLHLGVYARYGAGAVVHTHAPAATALSCVVEELPCVHYQMLLLGGDVRVAPYRTFGTPELAAATLDALEGKTAALMANHGAITYSHDLAHAVENTKLLEWAAALYIQAVAVGTPRVLTEAERAAVIEVAVQRSYGQTRRVRE